MAGPGSPDAAGVAVPGPEPTNPMHNAKSKPRTPHRATAPRRTPAGPSTVADDRRTRLRLRELCDEVLASHRVASDRDLFTDADRREAQALLGGLALARRG